MPSLSSGAAPSARRLDYHYIAMQAGFWAMFASICAYQVALLSHRGFSSGQAGIIVAIRCLAGIFCQPLLGRFADRHPHIPLRLIVAVSLSLGLAAGVVLMLFPMGIVGTSVAFFVLGGFELSAYPLMDSMAIQYISLGVPIRYSLGRGIGSLSYALCCIPLGIQVTQLGVESTLVTHAGILLVELLLVATFPVCPQAPAEAAEEKKPPHTIPWLLRSNRCFSVMLVSVFLGMTGLIPLSNFLIQVILSRGGTDGDLGTALFIMAAFELPTAFFFQRLYRRFGGRRLLLVSMVFCFVKVLAFLLAPSLAWIYAAQPLQMLGYGLFTPTSVYFVDESVPPEDRVTGQSIMMVASNGLGGVMGSLLAGWSLDLGGPNLMLLACLVCCGVSVALAAVAQRLPGLPPASEAKLPQKTA